MYTNHSSPLALENQDKFCTALFTLMAQKPFERVTITELCREAGFERMTFYRHFSDKTDIIAYYLDRQMMLLMASLPSSSTTEHNLYALFQWVYNERRNLSILMENHMTAQLAKSLAHSFFAVTTANLPPEAVRLLPPSPYSADDPYITDGVIGLFCGLLTSWRDNDFREPPKALTHRMLAILGLGSLLPADI